MTFNWDTIQNSDDALDWIIEHPPYECCVPIADLYQYSKGLEESPWELFKLIVGYDTTASSLIMLPLGGNNATYIGNAILQWGNYADIIDPYIKLISSLERDL